QMEQRADEIGFSVREVVTLASIVEREAKLEEERSRIAAVFLNRLNEEKRLESCATVQYILGKQKEELTNKDLQNPSPYNTYLHMGLPPGPIANPGLSS
ncbi:MAG TPA: endolytic transglycosylase MltG, partial [Peptococcaceae bacterium]|nr:endolytic transglycosylase MltG [Peptococcaceae bacterium]